ncbi:MAG: DedA family protein [Planctomycetes bacterium]|nr:DedA family protein [Planctomycetota bacterium]
MLIASASWATWGLLGLGLASFLAGGPLPFPSEVTLVALLEAGANPWLCLAVATLGNVLGALVVYGIGRGISRGGRLGERLANRYREDPARLDRARAHVDRWGSPLLVAAWIPVVGDVFVLAAGLSRVPLLPALAWLTLGKAARYGFVIWTFLQVR